MVGVLAIMVIKTRPVLALLGLGALPFLNIAATRFSNRIAPVNLALQQELADLSGVVEESLAGVRVVKGFGAERMQVQAARGRGATPCSIRRSPRRKLRAGFIPLIDFLPTLSLVAILWYGGHQVLDGKLQVGDILAFNLYILMLIWPLRMVGMLIAQASRASAGGGRVHEILVDRPRDRRPARRGRAAAGPGRGHASRACASGTAPGRAVLDGLDLTIRGGEAVALVGATGSGKTTVARLLPRFYDVDAGRVLLDGVDVRDMQVGDAAAVDRHRVRGHVPLLRHRAREHRVRGSGGVAGRRSGGPRGSPGADAFIDALPDGYDTVIGEHGFSLSGGQRQRIAIARAVIADPRVLILDDATSSVDPTKEHEIRAALREVMAGRTTMIIAHRPATIALADRVVLLADGRVVAEGTHEELLATSAALPRGARAPRPTIDPDGAAASSRSRRGAGRMRGGVGRAGAGRGDARRATRRTRSCAGSGGCCGRTGARSSSPRSCSSARPSCLLAGPVPAVDRHRRGSTRCRRQPDVGGAERRRRDLPRRRASSGWCSAGR